MKKLKKEVIFVQGYGTYTDQTLVIVGIKEKSKVYGWLKKNKVNPAFSKFVLENFDYWIDVLKESKALFAFSSDVQGTVIVLEKPNDSWEYWECVMHEVYHLVSQFSEHKRMWKEEEAKAYLFEYIFRSIRRKICGIDK